ncbi:MAG: DUF433 domain-containing protein [Verrucomicrobia bacterium]|nr:DUF433 domain-containing protein [Verrucomicrobiota bacterium]
MTTPLSGVIVSAMVAAIAYPHIVKAAGEPARLESHPRTRVAQIVMDYVGHGWSPDEIHRQHRHLTLAEIHSALAYYFDHAAEMDGEMDEEWLESERLARSTPQSAVLERLRALKRRHACPALP